MAARGNCGPQPHTAKLQVDSVPSGEPIYSLAFDPSLAPQHDGVPMHIGQFVLSWTANLSFSRDEQIPIGMPFLTCAWIWAYMLTASLMRALRYVPPAMEVISKIVDIANHPVKSLGYVTAAISGAVVWVLSVV